MTPARTRHDLPPARVRQGLRLARFRHGLPPARACHGLRLARVRQGLRLARVRHGLPFVRVRDGLPLLAGLLVAACGVRPTGVVGAGDPALAQQAVPQTTVYLARQGQLVPVRRVALPSTPQAALTALWQEGPRVSEAAQGLSNPLADLKEFDVVFNTSMPGALTVFFLSGGPVSDLLRAQIVCSGAAQPGVRLVRLIDIHTAHVQAPKCSHFSRYLAG
ncbi:hypothetical protein [Actinoallomurus sp. CA-150999]|uniref:hypothetical protein n=1 Tax=Actinoallomurus sp. CA-150999 TaxID=3239887 RepID=UPI003D911A45